MRGEFLVAFDILAATVGLELGLSGNEPAQLIFSKDEKNIITCDKIFLQTKFSIPNESIDMDEFVESSRICQTKAGMTN